MKLWTLPRILGLVAGVLAWIAALIRYNKTGEVNVSLIAAGAFFALISSRWAGAPRERRQGPERATTTRENHEEIDFVVFACSCVSCVAIDSYVAGYRSSCPTSFDLSAPGFGRNFCTRPLKTSARYRLPS